jgi:hypothetical protein
MTKHKNTSNENKNKKSENPFDEGCSKAFLEMMAKCCEGQRGTPNCCSGMKKIWENMQDKSQEDRKQK